MDETAWKKYQNAGSVQSSISSDASYLDTRNPDAAKPTHNAIPSPVLKAISENNLTIDQNGLVTFSYSSPVHPRNWPLGRKLYDTAVICTLECITTVVSNAGSNIAEEASADIGVSRELGIFCLATTYLLGQAAGGLIFPPVTEVFGSKLIYTSSSALYAALCLMTGLAPSLATVIVGRFLTGLLSAMPTCVACGSIENMWDSRARIWAIAIWAAAGIFGMAIGPLYAVGISESSLGWTWVFVLAGIMTAVSSILCLAMRESRPSQVLRKAVKKVERSTAYKNLRFEGASLQTLKEFTQTSLTLPIRLLFNEPIVALSSLMGATVVSLIYLFAEAVPVVYTSETNGFDLTRQQSAFVFLILGGGVLLFVLPRIYDIRIFNRRMRRNEPLEPEDKLPTFLVATSLLTIGLWWFGAAIPPIATEITPAVSMIPVVFIGFAAVEFDTVLSGYLTDVYGSYAASANAPMCFLRAIVSGVYPLFGRQMFEGLGPSWASFVLAGMATAYVGVAFWFWKSGRKIRMRSRFAEQMSGRSDVTQKT